MTTILALIGSVVIFIIAIALEESIMEELTGEGILETISKWLRRHINEK